jgi:hypothetical protein
MMLRGVRLSDLMSSHTNIIGEQQDVDNANTSCFQHLPDIFISKWFDFQYHDMLLLPFTLRELILVDL